MSTPVTLTGKKLVDVTFKDGSTSRFEVKELSIRRLYTFCELYASGNDFELVALCTGQMDTILDRLQTKSFSELVGLCHEVNFPLATPLIQGSPTLAGKMIPALARLQASLADLPSLVSSTPSLEPAPSVSKAEAGSE